MSILYLHGRGETADSPPGDVVRGEPWGGPLYAPTLTPEWLARPFAEQVDDVDRWMEACRFAIGHSFGGWLLLCAAEQRLARQATVPPLLGLSCVLGRGLLPGSKVGFFAPRATRVREALGLDGAGPGSSALRERLTLIHGEEDAQCPPGAARELAGLGYAVTLVPGAGHHLWEPRARAAVRVALRSVRLALT
jgi:pimeloyl-ACP methyl ester carboxylesterase